MSSYGDPNAGYGRAQVPRSDGYGYEYDDYDEAPPPPPRREPVQQWPDNGGGYGVGSGYEGGGGYDAPPGGGYDGGGYPPPPPVRASGSAAVGSASVGRATVGRAAVVGSASVPTVGGRARVRPAGPADDLDFDPLGGPGGDDGADGPGGPPGTGGRSRKGGSSSAKPATATSKKRKRRKILLASFAAVIILMGTGAIAGTYFFDSVDAITPDKLPNQQVTAVYAADGKTQLAQLGAENRIAVDVTKLKPEVQHALIAGEDKNFYNHHGVDFAGIARAAWNNITSSDTQGASTITQQYVKFATQDMDISYGRKLREAVLARKLEDKYTKDQILGFYLNTIPFGRGAIGVEKAAQAYFDHGADKLTVEEAAILGSVIKQPFSPDGSGSPYDPEVNLGEATTRWNYVLDMMVAANWMDSATRQAAVYPKTWKPKSKNASTAEWGINGPGPSGMVTGNVLNYVYSELAAWGITSEMVKTGGYKIITTIDPKIQAAAEAQARRAVKNSVISKTKPTVMAAIVAINPANGRVLAYYGGEEGTGHDYAGRNIENGVPTGGHPPGSSMKPYTLAAALQANYSLESRWLAKPGKYYTYNVQNAGRKTTVCDDYCTLETSLVQSYNVPFIHVAKAVGVDKVVDMAHKAGVTMIWGLDPKTSMPAPVDITKPENIENARNKGIDLPVGYGQYGITVLDHASGMATFAAGGIYNKPHFVVRVEKRNPNKNGAFEAVPGAGAKEKGEQTIPAGIAADVTYAMEKVTASHSWSIDGGRDTASKTGTWELNSKSSGNGHAWVVGFTKQIAVAVWVGNAGKEVTLEYTNGTDINSGNAPADIWNKFLDTATKGQKRETFPGEAGVGSDQGGNGVSPTPSAPVQGCLPLLPCPGNSDNPGGGGGPGGQNSPSPSASPSRSRGRG
ncbi:membrane peptidoglycan carboxypeptidase [Allocatelliglobosispora scoriae]|uniref:Membrane peptidoglycan carboxypeptidase n=1 Tax=Allocatelliglobosispora scoriae TaxID=643052 RepID=A0A841BU63_9ACTN|nr:transglycosylase domain-containing protein [Allocatelliglobosispora scoriae]MBB5870988.1 membrane peptidoglycan carboxypeptidase [Allocatelliglobosispora scoriae]